MAAVQLEGVSRTVGSSPILDDVDLEVADDELLVLLGRSGSGKSSVLRAIAGLDPLDHGCVRMGGEDVTEVATRDRDVAIVFQQRSLFPTHDVRANVGFPLRARKRPEQEIRHRVTAEVRALGIEDLLERTPGQLSEGQQRLVEIARAMVRVPRVFLLDEPLSDLDPVARSRLRSEIRVLQAGYGVAMVYATNDPQDAMTIADRVAVLDAGRVVQVAPPGVIRADPIDRSTAVLTGALGLLDGRVVAGDTGYWVEGPTFRIRAWAEALSAHVDDVVAIGVRPEQILLDDHGPVAATVGPVTYRDGSFGRDVILGDSDLPAVLPVELDEGSTVRIRFGRWHLFDSSGHRICTVG